MPPFNVFNATLEIASSLPPDEARVKLSRALLPLNWQGKGCIGEVAPDKAQPDTFWIQYKSPYYRSIIGPRLKGTIRPANDTLGSKLESKFVFHRAQWWIVFWLLGMGTWTSESLSQQFAPPHTYTLQPSLFQVLLPEVTLALSLLFLVVSFRHEKKHLAAFLQETFAPLPMQSDDTHQH